MFVGTYTALITPFQKGQVDEKAFQKMIQDYVRGGVDGIVPVGLLCFLRLSKVTRKS